MTLRLGRHSFADDRRLMMAIVNRTPDSFYDKGATWWARIFRVHQVTETRHVVDMVDVVWGRRPPARTIRGLA